MNKTIKHLSTPSTGVCFSFALLVLFACAGQSIEGYRLFKEKQSEDQIGDGRTAAAVFQAEPVGSGARSAYQLAPFGEGFGFADLFSLFSQRDIRKQTTHLMGSDEIPFQLEDNLISMYGDQTTIESDNKVINLPRQSGDISNLRSPMSTKARGFNLGPWTRIISATQTSDSKHNVSASSGNTSTPATSPIILVPGYGGSRLEAKLDKPGSVHYFCDSRTDWIDLWINVKQLLPYMIDCLIDNMRLEFDTATNQTKNPAGVDIRVKNGSRVASVEYLNNLQISGFAYFAPIIEQLTSGKLGYEREFNIRAAPYDFRKAPNELGDYFDNLKDQSEQLVRENGGRPISYICHSMGCNNMLYFLHRQASKWKAQHVKRLISIAAPWAGSVSAMRAAAVGDDLGMPYLFSESKLLLVQRSLPSTIFLFPHKQAFSGIPLVKSYMKNLLDRIPKQPPNDKQHQQQSSDLASDGTKNRLITRSPASNGVFTKQQRVYTADDFGKFFEDINHPDGYKMWLNTKDLLGSLEAPGVEVWCLVGGGKRTLARIEYAGEFPTSQSQELYDDGDGTVTIQSADYCKRWSSSQQQPVYYKQFEADHLAILKNNNVLEYIERILGSDLATHD